ncbi:DUF1611 domain-containing protein [Brachybacterium sp. P6-10-X1]|uniref:DUF1611 domain-containing protein n=1 Tax=Brachybacterium sp. P6-10-X1 TaxID=1903186 RepID=UPI000971B85E|nr:DUF1611 domain-containing protein [Brachybacterium sp. P6-10-X1]APX33766.1 DUF1611 domain-containing protein [Brachybacterium sp. P6-10-X1]
MTILNESATDTATRPAATPIAAPETAPGDLRTRIERAKHAFSTRDVGAFLRRADGLDLLTGNHIPQAGEVVLARVSRIGHHKRLESPVSRRQVLFPGDEIVVAYGNRYAADQFLAAVPDDLGPAHLAAAGGLASRVVEQHDQIAAATEIEPIGVLRDAHGPVTLARAAAHHVVQGIASRPDRPAHRVPVIAVLGTSMNSGKSTVLAQLAHGLSAAGLRVAAGKTTGTGAGNDYNLFLDAGAHRVLDFTDFGYPSTFQVEADEVRDLFLSMADELAGGTEEPDVVLLEIADGVCQGETARLLADDEFGAVVDAVAFAAGDALGAVGGVGALGALGRIPAFVSGVVTSSPLATSEARRALQVPVVPTFALGTAEVAGELVAELIAERTADAA